jgi:hypothetical protein
MSELNRVLTLAARPVGFPKESDFKRTVLLDCGHESDV